eukprot:TRINITY_DN33806_c0_g1_i2.p1 TRINITY_DN33806_c0_g1~~TRINITY_DN33806_c0_g1_i2.p1  ORF type:complete len:610 (+),score=55.25 TRINITY_DN33806_c0_g1_i2:87-1916(+)
MSDSEDTKEEAAVLIIDGDYLMEGVEEMRLPMLQVLEETVANSTQNTVPIAERHWFSVTPIPGHLRRQLMQKEAPYSIHDQYTTKQRTCKSCNQSIPTQAKRDVAMAVRVFRSALRFTHMIFFLGSEDFHDCIQFAADQQMCIWLVGYGDLHHSLHKFGRHNRKGGVYVLPNTERDSNGRHKPVKTRCDSRPMTPPTLGGTITPTSGCGTPVLHPVLSGLSGLELAKDAKFQLVPETSTSHPNNHSITSPTEWRSTHNGYSGQLIETTGDPLDGQSGESPPPSGLVSELDECEGGDSLSSSGSLPECGDEEREFEAAKRSRETRKSESHLPSRFASIPLRGSMHADYIDCDASDEYEDERRSTVSSASEFRLHPPGPGQSGAEDILKRITRGTRESTKRTGPSRPSGKGSEKTANLLDQANIHLRAFVKQNGINNTAPSATTTTNNTQLDNPVNKLFHSQQAEESQQRANLKNGNEATQTHNNNPAVTTFFNRYSTSTVVSTADIMASQAPPPSRPQETSLSQHGNSALAPLTNSAQTEVAEPVRATVPVVQATEQFTHNPYGFTHNPYGTPQPPAFAPPPTPPEENVEEEEPEDTGEEFVFTGFKGLV